MRSCKSGDYDFNACSVTSKLNFRVKINVGKFASKYTLFSNNDIKTCDNSLRMVMSLDKSTLNQGCEMVALLPNTIQAP